MNKPFLLISIFLMLTYVMLAQSISGHVVNDRQEPIAFANVWIQQLNTGTTADEYGKYFFVLDVAGEYDLIFSSLGYETKSVEIIFGDNSETLNVELNSSNLELEEVVVMASKKDPAYGIMKKVVANKERYLKQVNSYRTKVYVKATEIAEKKKKKRRAPDNRKSHVGSGSDGLEDEIDLAAQEERMRIAELTKISLLEMELTLNFEQPNSYKEERTAYRLYGDKSALFVPLFGEVNFNFYRNTVSMIGVAENPIISPLSKLAVLSYKFKLMETTLENDVTVYKIKVSPRKKGSSTCEGYLYINDESWNINRLELSFNEGGLMFFDALKIKQRHRLVSDSIWVVDRLEFEYETKIGKSNIFKGNTIMRLSDYQHNFMFPRNYFNNELSITSAEAYERDTNYWREVRLEKLSQKEQSMIAHRDSVKAIYSSKEYKDSVQQEYNKITFTDVVYGGVGFRNHEKSKHIYIGSLPELIDFSVIGGFRLGPYLGYFKRWKNGRYVRTNSTINIGLKNLDVQGNGSVSYRYNPHKLADVYVSGGRSFYSINSNDAFLNQLKVSNYILHDDIEIGHSFEPFNGFDIYTNVNYSGRKSVQRFDAETFIDDWFEEEFEPLEFENYEAFNTLLVMAYTPGRRYMTEPDRKILLGSKYPTVSFTHRKGWRGIFSSDTDFDFVKIGVDQNISFGAFGQSKYSMSMGQYTNTKDLRIVDLKRFRQSDPILMSEPLTNFQLLDTSFASTKLFFELHHIHHFNGALVNNMPLLKKTRIRAVAGGGMLWIKEADFRHVEAFAGLERVFKVGKRRRLRIGAYGVVANSSYSKTRSTFKISFDLIDSWKRDWSY